MLWSAVMPQPVARGAAACPDPKVLEVAQMEGLSYVLGSGL